MKRVFFPAIAAILFFAPAGTRAQVNLDSGLVAYYPFNGNANDESGNGNDGVTYGVVPVNDRLNHLNSAYSFNGADSWIKMGDNQDLHLFDSTSFSLFAWIFIDPSWHNGDIMRYDDGDNSDGDVINSRYLYLFRVLSSGKLNFQFGNPTGNFASTSSESLIDPGKWYPVAAVRSVESDSFYIHINGNKEGIVKDPTVGEWETTGQYLMSGRYVDGGQYTHYFSGKMDDLRIYKRALNMEEIVALSQNFPNSLSNTFLTSLSLHPNPSPSTFHLHAELPTPSQPTYSVLNQLGQVVWQAREAQAVQVIDREINLSSQPNGIYHLRISDGSGSMSRQLVLRR